MINADRAKSLILCYSNIGEMIPKTILNIFHMALKKLSIIGPPKSILHSSSVTWLKDQRRKNTFNLISTLFIVNFDTVHPTEVFSV